MVSPHSHGTQQEGQLPHLHLAAIMILPSFLLLVILDAARLTASPLFVAAAVAAALAWLLMARQEWRVFSRFLDGCREVADDSLLSVCRPEE
jgi:hypothetical protein